MADKFGGVLVGECRLARTLDYSDVPDSGGEQWGLIPMGVMVVVGQCKGILICARNISGVSWWRMEYAGRIGFGNWK